MSETMLPENYCPECGFRTAIARGKKKVGKKLVLTDNYIRYCCKEGCDWEQVVVIEGVKV